MIKVNIPAVEHYLSELEIQLKELYKCIEALRRALARLSNQKGKGLEKQIAALRAKLREMEEQAEMLKRLILAIARALQLYIRNEEALIAEAETTIAVSKRLHLGKISVDTGFVDRLGLRVGI